MGKTREIIQTTLENAAPNIKDAAEPNKELFVCFSEKKLRSTESMESE